MSFVEWDADVVKIEIQDDEWDNITLTISDGVDYIATFEATVPAGQCRLRQALKLQLVETTVPLPPAKPL